MSETAKKQDSSHGGGQQIHVGRDVVNNASRLTSGTLNRMCEELLLDVVKEIEKKENRS